MAEDTGANRMTQPGLVVLVDWRLGDQPFWLSELLKERGFTVQVLGIPNYEMRNRIVKWRKLLLWWQYAVLGWRGARLARRTGSTIVAWNFIAGVFATLASQCARAPRPAVVSLNAIAFAKGRLHNAGRALAYRLAFATDRLWLTVNSEELRELYEEWFGFKRSRVEVLRDCWTSAYLLGDPSEVGDPYVFSGGEASRDWPVLLQIAEECPDIPFEVVARRKYWPSALQLPANVHVQFDTSEDAFYTLVEHSRLVLVPLKTEVTAGLIVLIRAALLGRLVISTRTPATESCYPAELRGSLSDIGDAAGLRATLEHFWNDGSSRLHAARALYDFIHTERSPAVFADRVADLARQAVRYNGAK